jgi:hypothetical protein
MTIRSMLSGSALSTTRRHTVSPSDPKPLSAEEEAKFRESVRLLGDDGRLHWTNNAAARLLATLDAARQPAPEDASPRSAEPTAALRGSVALYGVSVPVDPDGSCPECNAPAGEDEVPRCTHWLDAVLRAVRPTPSAAPDPLREAAQAVADAWTAKWNGSYAVMVERLDAPMNRLRNELRFGGFSSETRRRFAARLLGHPAEPGPVAPAGRDDADGLTLAERIDQAHAFGYREGHRAALTPAEPRPAPAGLDVERLEQAIKNVGMPRNDRHFRADLDEIAAEYAAIARSDAP